MRPLVEKSLWLIEIIPIYGSKIAGTIRFLTKVADLACPAAAAQRSEWMAGVHNPAKVHSGAYDLQTSGHSPAKAFRATIGSTYCDM